MMGARDALLFISGMAAFWLVGAFRRAYRRAQQRLAVRRMLAMFATLAKEEQERRAKEATQHPFAAPVKKDTRP
jgi:hypothetical protein